MDIKPIFIPTLRCADWACRSVSTCHTWYDTDLVVSIYGMADRFVLRRYTRVVAVSNEVRQRLLKAGVSAEKIRLVRNGIDLRLYDGAIASLRAGAAVKSELDGRPGWTPGMGEGSRSISGGRGGGPCRSSRDAVQGGWRRARAREIGAVDRSLEHSRECVHVGASEDMTSLYASLDVMVSSSRQEGMPIAILEGMASGLPVVATAVGEVPTVVEDGRTGILVPPGDAGQLAAAVVELLHNPEKRRRLGSAARHLIEEEYSATRMTADYLRVYQEAIASIQTRRSGQKGVATSKGSAR